VMRSYDSDKRVRAGSYQVDPIAKIVLKPKEKKPKKGKDESEMIKEEVGEESDDDKTKPLK